MFGSKMEMQISKEIPMSKDEIVNRIIQLSEIGAKAEKEMNDLCPLLDKHGTTIEEEIDKLRNKQ